METEKTPRRRRVRYKHRGTSARLEVIIAAVFAVIGVVLTITFVHMTGDAWGDVNHVRTGMTESSDYPTNSPDPTPPVA